MQRTHRSAALLAATALLSLAAGPASAGTNVYAASNLPGGNSVIQFEQSAEGTLTVVAEYATGGLGTGTGLGNQGAIAADDSFLFVVDAGSNEVSSFRLTDDGLEFADRIDSGGIRPVSVTASRGLLYVVNAGSDSIAGFEVAASGELSPLPNAIRPLSSTGTGPAQISFSKDGRVLIVTEKATNSLVSYAVDRRGIPGAPQVYASPGQTPFGFAVTSGRRILVSEAAGGAAGQSSVSSWQVGPDGDLQVLDAAVPTLQTAACWVAVTPNGRLAFTTNTGSNSVTAYRVTGGKLALANDDGRAATTGGAPIDMAVSPDGRFLHTLDVGSDTISSFRIGNQDELQAVGTYEGLPDRATGLVAVEQ